MKIDSKVFRYGSASSRQVFKHCRLAIPHGVKLSPIYRPLVFIHGGAWRDPSNTYNDFDKWIDFIDGELNLSSPYIEQDDSDKLFEKQFVDFFVVDYRLSPEVKHPAHLCDVLSSLQNIKRLFKIDEVILVGHSVGATLITQVLDYKRILDTYKSKDLGLPIDSTSVPQVSSVVFLDGIYDIADMLQEYPSYSFFVDDAFDSSSDSLMKCNMLQIDLKDDGHGDLADYFKKLYGELDVLIILHSKKDELLSLQQPEFFINWLTEKVGLPRENIDYIVGDFGLHNEVYVNLDVGRIITSKLLI